MDWIRRPDKRCPYCREPLHFEQIETLRGDEAVWIDGPRHCLTEGCPGPKPLEPALDG